jgi:hypothetical protein
LSRLASPVARTLRGVAAAVRARPWTFAAVAAGVFLLQVALPVAVLSLARKPWDYAAFNAWLPKLPDYLAAPQPALPEKLRFLWGLALFWFIADGPYGYPEWGFSVGVNDIVRMSATALLFGAFFALWRHQRAAACALPGAKALPAARRLGATGVAASVLGLSTGPCGVIGCGAPVLPVVGLAFSGLSSGTLALLAGASTWATALVLTGVAAAVAYLGWLAGATRAEGDRSPLGA